MEHKYNESAGDDSIGLGDLVAIVLPESMLAQPLWSHRRTKEQDWQWGPEVAGGSYRSRVSLATGKWQRRRRGKTSANVLSMFWTVWGVEFAATRTPEGERGK